MIFTGFVGFHACALAPLPSNGTVASAAPEVRTVRRVNLRDILASLFVIGRCEQA
jgi:hypothetical protein